MPYTVEIAENKATFTLTIPQEKVIEGMQKAAKQISQESKIPGFRPGKANYEVIKKRIGDMKLLEAAAEDLIRAEFVAAMIEENLETCGQPFFETVKMAPENEMIIKATVTMFPKCTKLADYKKLEVKKNATKPEQKSIDRAKKDLALMRTKETAAPKDHKITKGDKVIVNLLMKEKGVVLEGGEGQGHAIYTGEDYFIEGFVDKITGLKAGETPKFKLPFPKDHYLKHLAGKKIDFEVEIKEIFLLEAPELNDEFAKNLGLKNTKDLEEKLVENLTLENEREESVRQEKEIIKTLADKSKFDEIPDLLVNQEIAKMTHEMQTNIEAKGGNFDDYLKSINKTIADIKLDFAPAALMRIKGAIVLKEIAETESIKPTNEEIDAELDAIADRYKENKDAQTQIFEPRFRVYTEQRLRDQKTMQTLKEIMVK